MAGFRTFATGEVLTAANVNDFLMKQSVMVFDDATARTTALGAEVAEGMLTFNKDTGQLEVFDGSAFVLAAPAPPAGIGSNVVSDTSEINFSTSSTSFVTDTQISVSFTPTTATSKVFVMLVVGGGTHNTNNSRLDARIAADGAVIGLTDGARKMTQSAGNSDYPLTTIALHSPNTTSSITLTAEYRTDRGTVSVSARTLIAFEVAA